VEPVGSPCRSQRARALRSAAPLSGPCSFSLHSCCSSSPSSCVARALRISPIPSAWPPRPPHRHQHQAIASRSPSGDPFGRVSHRRHRHYQLRPRLRSRPRRQRQRRQQRLGEPCGPPFMPHSYSHGRRGASAGSCADEWDRRLPPHPHLRRPLLRLRPCRHRPLRSMPLRVHHRQQRKQSPWHALYRLSQP
jgi:hypothetical protein